MRRGASFYLWLAFGLIVAAIPAGGMAAAWALFFTLGFKGGSTEEMFRYNLENPVLALTAYLPIVLVGVMLLVAVIAGARGIMLSRSKT